MSTSIPHSHSFNQKQLSAILDNTVDGIIVINAQGIILSFNQACEKLFGFTPQEVLGKNIKILMPDRYAEHHDGYIANYLSTREAKIIGIGREAEGQHKDKSTFPMYLSIGEVIEDDTHFFVGIIRNISAQKEYEKNLKTYTKQLEHSNKELDEFVYLVSHDLKEPVRGIYSYSQFLLEDHEDQLEEDAIEKLNSLIKMSNRMDDLINRLLEFSRLGRAELSYKDTDLEKTLDEVLEMMDSILKSGQIEIIRPKKMPTILCDHIRTSEIFRNLIMNAIKYNDKPTKTVEIGYNPHPDNRDVPVFFVKDNGIGIPKHHYNSIFKMFKRLHQRDDFGGGTGAGLSIVQRIITQHGGKIWVESEEGKETTFYFTLAEV